MGQTVGSATAQTCKQHQEKTLHRYLSCKEERGISSKNSMNRTNGFGLLLTHVPLLCVQDIDSIVLQWKSEQDGADVVQQASQRL